MIFLDAPRTTGPHFTTPRPTDLPGARWNEVCDRFLAAIPVDQRSVVQDRLQHLHYGGSGLREWVTAIAWRGSALPQSLPSSLVEVYLKDSEAAPLFDCEDCGVAIPVRPNHMLDFESEPELNYFPRCPVCGGRTGWYLFCSREAQRSAESRACHPANE